MKLVGVFVLSLIYILISICSFSLPLSHVLYLFLNFLRSSDKVMKRVSDTGFFSLNSNLLQADDSEWKLGAALIVATCPGI